MFPEDYGDPRGYRSTPDRAAVEISKLKEEVQALRDHRKAEQQLRFDQMLDSRTKPPMSQMTRIQKRYFLEPWMTVAAIASGTIAVVMFGLAAFAPWLDWARFFWFGVMWVILTVIAVVMKVVYWENNEKLEGQVEARRQYSDLY